MKALTCHGGEPSTGSLETEMRGARKGNREEDPSDNLCICRGLKVQGTRVRDPTLTFLGKRNGKGAESKEGGSDVPNQISPLMS